MHFIVLVLQRISKYLKFQFLFDYTAPNIYLWIYSYSQNFALVYLELFVRIFSDTYERNYNNLRIITAELHSFYLYEHLVSTFTCKGNKGKVKSLITKHGELDIFVLPETNHIPYLRRDSISPSSLSTSIYRNSTTLSAQSIKFVYKHDKEEAVYSLINNINNQKIFIDNRDNTICSYTISFEDKIEHEKFAMEETSNNNIIREPLKLQNTVTI